jgi:hypothetical protein
LPLPYHVAKTIIDGRSIRCTTAEDRQLLLQGKAIGNEPARKEITDSPEIIAIGEAAIAKADTLDPLIWLAKSREATVAQLQVHSAVVRKSSE